MKTRFSSGKVLHFHHAPPPTPADTCAVHFTHLTVAWEHTPGRDHTLFQKKGKLISNLFSLDHVRGTICVILMLFNSVRFNQPAKK